MIPTAVVTDVDSFISHEHRKNSGVSRPTRSRPTVWRTSEEMEHISNREKPRYDYDDG